MVPPCPPAPGPSYEDLTADGKSQPHLWAAVQQVVLRRAIQQGQRVRREHVRAAVHQQRAVPRARRLRRCGRTAFSGLH